MAAVRSAVYSCAVQHLGDARTPKSEAPVTDGDGMQHELRWYLWKAIFCPAPQRGRHMGQGCFSDWKRANGRWGGEQAWRAFYAACSDDWPQLTSVSAAQEI